MQKFFQTYGFPAVLVVLAGILIPLLIIGTTVYLIQYIGAFTSLKDFHPPFELAILSTALGGFLLTIAYHESRLQLNHWLKINARLFLGAAVSFTLVYILLFLIRSITSNPLRLVDWLAVGLTDLIIVASVFLFSFALVLLTVIVIRWKAPTEQ
jgi:hypothetical protein